MTDPLAVSVKEACRHLGGIHVATLYRYLDQKKLEGCRVGGRRLILMSSIRRVLGEAA